jgi:hypothetical protein
MRLYPSFLFNMSLASGPVPVASNLTQEFIHAASVVACRDES